MQGIRFYLEYNNKTEKNKSTRKNPGNHTGNVIAVMYENGYFISNQEAHQDAIGALNFTSDSPVCSTTVGDSYLTSVCKRISENQARSIHPNLFHYLDL